MPNLPVIDPMTDADLTISIAIAGSAITNATVVASVYGPDGAQVADNVTLEPVGDGTYTLLVSRDWSTTESDTPITGRFAAEIVASTGTDPNILKHTVRYMWITAFTQPAATL